MDDARDDAGPLGSKISNFEPPGEGDFLDFEGDIEDIGIVKQLVNLLGCLFSTEDDLGGGGFVGGCGGKFGAKDARVAIVLFEGRLGGKGVESVSEGEPKPCDI